VQVSLDYKAIKVCGIVVLLFCVLARPSFFFSFKHFFILSLKRFFPTMKRKEISPKGEEEDEKVF
jgi:hypothetical protein